MSIKIHKSNLWQKVQKEPVIYDERCKNKKIKSQSKQMSIVYTQLFNGLFSRTTCVSQH